MAVQSDWLNTNYYDVLGVAENASDKDIRRAYRKLARELHPDTNDDPGAERRFKDITAAQEVLGDRIVAKSTTSSDASDPSAVHRAPGSQASGVAGGGCGSTTSTQTSVTCSATSSPAVRGSVVVRVSAPTAPPVARAAGRRHGRGPGVERTSPRRCRCRSSTPCTEPPPPSTWSPKPPATPAPAPAPHQAPRRRHVRPVAAAVKRS